MGNALVGRQVLGGLLSGGRPGWENSDSFLCGPLQGRFFFAGGKRENEDQNGGRVGAVLLLGRVVLTGSVLT